MVLMGIVHAVNSMWSVLSLAYRGSTSDQSDECKWIAVDNRFFKQLIVTRVTN